jgi:hypothetical protein
MDGIGTTGTAGLNGKALSTRPYGYKGTFDRIQIFGRALETYGAAWTD